MSAVGCCGPNRGTAARGPAGIWCEDIAALQARKEYRREPAKAAESALGYGMPVLDSSLTLIDDGRLYYRGYDVPTLARERTFEEVAALLWTGSFAVDGLFAGGPPAAAGPLLPGDLGGLDPGSPIERFQAVLAAGRRRRPGGAPLHASGRRRHGGAHPRAAPHARAAGTQRGRRSTPSSLAATLQRGLGARPP